MECPPENQFVDFLIGDRNDRASEEIERHLDRCDGCAELVAELARLYPPEPPANLSRRTTGQWDAGVCTLGGAPATGPVPALPEGEKVGRYIVIGLLGAGAMGVVYSAYDPELDRRVAIKLLRNSVEDNHAAQAARLQREAQAMARLSHPNVITVHDVGTFAGQVFLAMEFIDGQTLSTWLRERNRPWREVLAVFLAAGRGLSAAHKAGLTHRDFKPDNVLIGRDDRVLVTDFGLARSTAKMAASSGESTTSSSLSYEPPHPPTNLTRTGAVVGTPAYMAPEQLSGRSTGPLSDQFSYCTALHEALYGVRPFAGNTMAELCENILAGNLRQPHNRNVPRSVRNAMLRGLLADPDERFTSMDALLAALGPRPWGWRRSGLVAVPVAAAALSAMVYAPTAAAPSNYCREIPAKLAGVWDQQRADALRGGFLATRRSFAQHTWESVGPQLDAYADAWVGLQQQACRNEVEGTKPSTIIALQMVCLEQARAALETASDILLDDPAGTVERAQGVVAALPALDGCADGNILVARSRTRPGAQTVSAAEFESSLAKARLLARAGKVTGAKSIAEAIRERAEGANDPWTAGRATEVIASALEFDQDTEAAEAAFHQALSWALRAADTETIGRSSLGLAWLHGDNGRLAEAKRWYEHGVAAIAQAAETTEPRSRIELQAELERSLAIAYLGENNLAAAEAHVRASIRIRSEGLNPSHVSLGHAYGDLGRLLSARGDHNGALAAHAESVRLATQELGPSHPSIGALLQNASIAQAEAGEHGQAHDSLTRARAIVVEALGPEHPRLITIDQNLASLSYELQDSPSGLRAARHALSLVEKFMPEDPEARAGVLGALAQLEFDEPTLRGTALRHAKQACELSELASNTRPTDRAGRIHNYANLVLASGDAETARRLFREAVLAKEAAVGPGDPFVASSLVGEAEALLALGRAGVARPLCERAQALLSDSPRPSDSEDRQRVAFLLGQIRWAEDPSSRPQVEAQAKAMVATLDPGLRDQATLQADIHRWLAAR